jgi:glucosamine--fructose-6-phosphate aminotransferase (isomerizing)
MCGIVGAVSQRNISKILLEGLKRLEYRGYDSAGLALLDGDQSLQSAKVAGKVSSLVDRVQQAGISGSLGIAHTRWATHGKPTEKNAHPHISGAVAVVHNGIIENYQALRLELQEAGYVFQTETDSEVIAHLIESLNAKGLSLLESVQKAVAQFEGAYGLVVMSARDPDCLVVARSGSPLVIGHGVDEMFVASDSLALRQATDRFSYLEEGDIAEVGRLELKIFDVDGNQVERATEQNETAAEEVHKAGYRHFMEKEIFEQPEVIRRTMQGHLGKDHLLQGAFGIEAEEIFAKVEHVHIVACGTSYHSGLVAKKWLERWAGVHTEVDIASEYRYERILVHPNTLFVTISQSGETADTLAALRKAKEFGYLATFAICNVPTSSLVRESDIVFFTQAGPEIGVASTKAFTTQLVGLQLLALALGKHRELSKEDEKQIVEALHNAPEMVSQALKLDNEIQRRFAPFASRHHALFLGRGVNYPVAMEGALKLKEISYIHAEAYAAGELKHGPLALVDEDMPVVAIAPNDQLLDKLKSNLQEVKARGGKLYVFADKESHFANEEDVEIIEMPSMAESLVPIVYSIPLQLVSYHVALMKGTDVDQPRNLAKSVTVE